MSEQREEILEHLSGTTINVFKSALVDDGVYLEPNGEAGAGITVTSGALLLALHNLGFDVAGWVAPKTLKQEVVAYLTYSKGVAWEDRAEEVIKLVQGFEP